MRKGCHSNRKHHSPMKTSRKPRNTNHRIHPKGCRGLGRQSKGAAANNTGTWLHWHDQPATIDHQWQEGCFLESCDQRPALNNCLLTTLTSSRKNQCFNLWDAWWVWKLTEHQSATVNSQGKELSIHGGVPRTLPSCENSWEKKQSKASEM